mmetsp:Transcript_30951/g.65398  ORF Transcript_30951/g.65398 Transcript_30951/m.65398 type:complete len:457 (-) Transcript_30951:255-1625(-)|eukprot:CAMPEP_0172309124 /NCGR_PEP_ID=MMETSP1058-20130122/9504_1 /TAXON_ID=83371 /ORGANISM="Detonula confervacea, Strain CCMP 353" /LENGTH=456 /DNA_ID=CAMNT_0013021685 /DNA_START=81 /DNA_END=1451 /DNA_ORIENTATION=+
MRIYQAAAALLLSASASAFTPLPISRSTKYVKSTSTPTSLAALATDEMAPRNLPPLDPWATENGVQKVEGLELYSEDGLDWQYITTADIPTGTTIMYIPAGMCLASSAVAAELNAASNGGLASAVDQLNKIGGMNSVADFYLFIKFLVEYEAQENSPYFPWLDSLPRLYYNSVSMTDFCYECLPPLVFSLSRLEKVKFDNFNQVLGKVDIVSDYTKGNMEVLKWAFNTVYTRAYADKDGQGSDVTITPLGDMFNHGTDTDIEVYFDEGGNAMVYTTKDVPANSPLRISYGCPTNPSFLFARYGFLDETSPATFCKMMDIPKTDENVNMGMDFSKMLFYHDTGDISPEVLDVVLYAKVLTELKSSPETDGYKQAFYQAHMTGDENTKAQIHEQFRYETMCGIKKHVDTFLEALDVLESKSYGKSLDEHPRLPLILRHNEFVKQTFLKVQANLSAYTG